MPYATIEDLPKNLRERLPVAVQEIYMATFNHAWDEYPDEETAFKVAWAAVKRRYRKEQDGQWIDRFAEKPL